MIFSMSARGFASSFRRPTAQMVPSGAAVMASAQYGPDPSNNLLLSIGRYPRQEQSRLCRNHRPTPYTTMAPSCVPARGEDLDQASVGYGKPDLFAVAVAIHGVDQGLVAVVNFQS